MRVACLFSGGKDSNLALFRAINQGLDVRYLVTVFPRSRESYMYHYPCIRITELQAKCIGLPLISKESIPEKERELEDLKETLSKLDIDGVVSGALASEYQKRRIERICGELKIESITPLWQDDPVSVLREVSEKFHVIISGVSAQGLKKDLIGRDLDRECVEKLMDLNRKYKIHLTGEGGEFETLVLDAPFFRKRIEILEKEVIWEGDSGYLDIKKATLIDKH
ncbi:MAG: TIGR00289 family protein [Candidatus Hydrothermarchaeota archaeon]